MIGPNVPPSLRVYLEVSFADNAAARAHGALWDAVRRRWWVDRRDLAENPGVHRWITSAPLAKQAREAEKFWSGSKPGRLTSPPPPPKKTTSSSNVQQMAPHVFTAPITLRLCACNVAPWEHCEHTREPAGGNAG